MRILYGLERLPRDPGNPRLPAVAVGPAMLRLNSEPLPAEVAPVEPSHAARIGVLRDWLLAQCGDYAQARRRFIAVYLDWVAAEIERNRSALAARLARFDGLYAPEDFFWSAPRPLPRAWISDGDEWKPADIAFWDGTRAICIEPRQSRDSPLPESFARFWDAETLPSSPFRRPLDWLGDCSD